MNETGKNSHNQEFEDAEIVTGPRTKKQKMYDGATDFAAGKIQDEINGVKNRILLIGGLYLFMAGLIFFAVIGLIVWLLSFILPTLFIIFITVALFAGIFYAINAIYLLFNKK